MPRKKTILATDNDSAVEALKSEEFPKMKDAEALNVALALQEILRGQNSILANVDTLGGELQKLRKRMDSYDQATQKYNENREKFVQEVFDKAASLKATGAEKDKLIAQGALQMQEAVKQARAANASDKLRFEENLARMPKVTVISPGEWVTGSVSGGAPTQQLVPEVVKIKHKTWVIPVGKPVEVPQAVADVLEQRRRSEQETRERQLVLSKNLNNDELNAQTVLINQKYKTNSVLPFQE